MQIHELIWWPGRPFTIGKHRRWDAQRRQGKPPPSSPFPPQEDVHRLGVIPVMVLQRVE